MGDQRSRRAPSSLRALTIIFAMQIRSLLRRKRLIFLVILLLLPPFVSLMMKLNANTRDAWLDFMPQAFLVFLVPILSLFHGASAVADEVDDRTLGFLLMRPIARDLLIFGKVMGAAAVTAVLASFSMALCHQITYWQGSPSDLVTDGRGLQLLHLMGLLAWASLLYTTFAALLSLILKRPTLVGILYVMVFEVACCYAPGPLARVAMSTHFMRLMPTAFRRVEMIISEGANQPIPVAEPSWAAAILMLVTGLLTIGLLRRFRSYDLSGADEGDQ